MNTTETMNDSKLTRHILTPSGKKRLMRLIYDMSYAVNELLDEAATDVEALEKDGYAELRLFADLAVVRRDLEAKMPTLMELF